MPPDPRRTKTRIYRLSHKHTSTMHCTCGTGNTTSYCLDVFLERNDWQPHFALVVATGYALLEKQWVYGI